MAVKRSGELTHLQEKAIVALVGEGSVAAAARTAGCGERTLHRWLKEDALFRAEFKRCRRESFSHAVSVAQRLAPVAIATLGRIMMDSTAPQSARVGAACALLRFGRDSVELDDLAERIDTLEDRVVAEQDGEAGRV
jgi:hypothetical protein